MNIQIDNGQNYRIWRLRGHPKQNIKYTTMTTFGYILRGSAGIPRGENQNANAGLSVWMVNKWRIVL